MAFDTPLTPSEEEEFKVWREKYVDPRDTGEDYDLRGAFKAGLTPDRETGHWPDTYKKPNHETFSDESIYSSLVGTRPGSWENNERYIPFEGKGSKMDFSSFMGEGFGNTGDIGSGDYGSLTGQPSNGTPEVSGIQKLAKVLQAGGSDKASQDIRDSIKKDLPGMLDMHLKGMKLNQGKTAKDLVEDQLNSGHFKQATDRQSIYKNMGYNKIPDVFAPGIQVAGALDTTQMHPNVKTGASSGNIAQDRMMREIEGGPLGGAEMFNKIDQKKTSTLGDQVQAAELEKQRRENAARGEESRKALGPMSKETFAQRLAREKKEADAWAASFK